MSQRCARCGEPMEPRALPATRCNACRALVAEASQSLFDELMRSGTIRFQVEKPRGVAPRRARAPVLFDPVAMTDPERWPQVDPAFDPSRCRACLAKAGSGASAALFGSGLLATCPACGAMVCKACLNYGVAPVPTQPGMMRHVAASCVACEPFHTRAGLSKAQLEHIRAQGVKPAPLRVEVVE